MFCQGRSTVSREYTVQSTWLSRVGGKSSRVKDSESHLICHNDLLTGIPVLLTSSAHDVLDPQADRAGKSAGR
eukprot:3768909-Rhodomonas_salina.1